MDVAGGVLRAVIRLVLETEHDQRGALREHVEEAERRSVDRPVRIQRRHQRNRPWHHHAAEQLVAIAWIELAQGYARCAMASHHRHLSGGGTAPVWLVIRP